MLEVARSMGGGHFQEFEDEYLETLFEFHEKDPGQRVKNGDLANFLSVSPASATEMVQRLAKNGYVDNVPYKGALLTDEGMVLGKQIKRRHRLAEVLLSRLPFVGDIHQTACRMEHAFDDDLEVCISLLLGNPKIDNGGKQIPEARGEIQSRLIPNTDIVPLSQLEGGKAEVVLIMTNEAGREVLSQIGLKSGSLIEGKNGQLILDGNQLELVEDLAKRIIVRCL